MSLDSPASAPPQSLASVIRRLHAEFPGAPREQVLRCVQVARSMVTLDAGSLASDWMRSLAAVEDEARGYLAKVQAVRKPAATPVPTVDVRDSALQRRRIGRHRQDNRGSTAGVASGGLGSRWLVRRGG